MSIRFFKKSHWMIALALVVVAGLEVGARAGSLEPPGPPQSTMKTLEQVEPRVPILQANVPMILATPGSYYLAENLSVAGGSALYIDGPGVSVDLNGYSISGSGGAVSGIDMATASGATVRNGVLEGFYVPVSVYDSSHITLSDLIVRDNTGAYPLMQLDTSSDVRVERCHLSGSLGVGIQLYAASDVVIRDGTIQGSTGDGIAITGGSQGVTVQRNVVSANSRGIVADGASGVEIGGNTTTDNTLHGIWLNNATDVVVHDNTSTGNAQAGILFEGTTTTGTVTDNRVFANSYWGIAAGTNVTDVTVARNLSRAHPLGNYVNLTGLFSGITTAPITSITAGPAGWDNVE